MGKRNTCDYAHKNNDPRHPGMTRAIEKALPKNLALRVLRPLARLMMPVLLALDLARIAGQQPGFSERSAQRFRGCDERARDSVTDRIGLRRSASAMHFRQDIVVALGLGNFERLQNPHPRGIAR